MTEKTRLVIAQEWEESERGWGVRPDGVSLHVDEKAHAEFVKKFWEREKSLNEGGGVPDCYSREAGRPVPLSIPESLFKKVKKAGTGMWITDAEYRTLRKK